MYAVICRQPAACGERDNGDEPSRAQPILAVAGRTGLTAPHQTGPLYSQLHLPAMTRTLKEEDKPPWSRSRRGAPSSVSEVICNSSADVGSARCCCRRCILALALCPVSVLYSSVRTRISQLLKKKKCFCWRKRNIPAGEILDHVPCAFCRTLCSPVSAFQVVLRT